jgi:hypothetical protein
MRQQPSFQFVQQPSIEDKIKLFESLYPNGSLRQIQRKDIPVEIVEHLEGMSRRFIKPEDYKEDNFTYYFLIQHNHIPDFKTYVAEQDKVYDHLEESEKMEKNVYFYDMLGGVELGHAELRFQPNGETLYFKDRPFVGYTKTEDEYKRQGYAIDRLLEMGAYSQMQWGFPLYSGDQNETADKVWKELLKEGRAREVSTEHPTRKRYQLIL